MRNDALTTASTVEKCSRAWAVRRSGLAGPPAATAPSRGKSSGRGGSGSTTTTLPDGNPTRLLDEWADCMRSHGDPNQADPTIDANNDIDVTWNPAVPGGIDGTNKVGQGDTGPGQYCRPYLVAAQTALGGNHQPSSSDQVTLLKY